ncbi:MAG: hypothetical protein H6753_01295 [Candidatus Omnitrophica bacterium]|nr:hypothetical protein [Candidatus Omnitrophota bacterium]
MTTKRCSRCRNRKPLEQFVKNNKSRDGLNHYCRPCKRKIMQEYFATKEGIAAKKRMAENLRLRRKAASKKRK